MEILNNICLTIGQKNTLLDEKIDEKHIHDEITPISKFWKYFTPPETLREMIELREKNKCKNGHNVCICVICNEGFCLECKTLAAHSANHHAENGFYFNLLTGGTIHETKRKRYILYSLYENKMGQHWKPEK